MEAYFSCPFHVHWSDIIHIFVFIESPEVLHGREKRVFIKGVDEKKVISPSLLL